MRNGKAFWLGFALFMLVAIVCLVGVLISVLRIFGVSLLV